MIIATTLAAMTLYRKFSARTAGTADASPADEPPPVVAVAQPADGSLLLPVVAFAVPVDDSPSEFSDRTGRA
jgi:hypothetical protein